MRNASGILAVAGLLIGGFAAAATDGQTNVVLIVADYMGYSDIEPYGAQDVRTPSLSRLAADGVTMRQFYAAAPVCGPARAALYTGQYPARIGFEQNIRTAADGLSAALPSLPRWFKNAGYRTALFGKWHLGGGPDFTPNAHGFDEFLGHHNWTIGYYRHDTDRGEPGLYRNDRVVHRDGYLTDLLTDEAVSFIERNREQPFFLTVAYNAALPPYQPPGMPESDWDRGWDVNKASRSDYIAMVEQMDVGIGRVLGALDAHDLSRRTLVIYTYDHGGRHLVNSAPLFHGFANVWEGGIRTHAILRLPDVLPAGESSDLPAIAMDLTATMLDIAGLHDPLPTLDGVSLAGILTGDRDAPTRRLYWQADLYDFGKQRAIRDGQWKYVEHGNTQFLFDLDADVSERQNLFYERADTVRRLQADLDGWQARMEKN